MSVTPVIASLPYLDQITDEAYTLTFFNNMDRIFQYGRDNIVAKLKERDMDVLKALREHLLTEVGIMYPEYASKPPILRRNEHRIVMDIVYLGQSLVNRNPDKNLDLAYKPNNEHDDTNDTTDSTPQINEILLLVVEMKKEFSVMKKDHRALKIENDKLKTRLTA